MNELIKNATLIAASKMYISMHVFDLEHQTLQAIKTNEHIEQWAQGGASLQETVWNVMKHTTDPQSVGVILDFTDLSTLPERMRHQEVISTVFKGMIHGWCKARFIRIDESEQPKQLLYVVEGIEDDADSLTGLPTLNSFREHAGRLLQMYAADEEKSALTFLFFDIAKFKSINAQYGVDRGDEILCDVATLLKNIYEGGYAARVSADHFAVVTDVEDVAQSVQIFRERMDAMHPSIMLEVKCGAYLVSDWSIHPELACDLAKSACDTVKSMSGQHLYYYSEETQEKVNTHLYVVNHLDEAIANDWIKVYYQPVVRSLTGDLCGMEALVRWIDPVKGFLSPADFIPALEEARLIHKLDIHVIRSVARGYRRCIDNNLPVVPCSVNLSRLDFLLADIRQVISDIIEEYRVPHHMVNIEITESLFVEEAELIGKEIDAFRRQGFRVWMDDFGSGYSSLNALKDYSFDELKIDMQFLSNFNDKTRSILKSIVRMAKAIHIQTLAEGVETREQYEFLRSIGCEKIQGYYFGKPMLFADSMKHCLEKGMKVETLAWSEYYDEVGKVNFMDERPLAVIHDDGERFEFMYANDAFMEEMRSNDTYSIEEAEEHINADGSPMKYFFRNLAQKAGKAHEDVDITYPSGDQYMSLKAKTIAECNGNKIHLARLMNVTNNAAEENQSAHDAMIRNLLYLYDRIAVADHDRDTTENYSFSPEGLGFQRVDERYNIRQAGEDYKHQIIYKEDWKEYDEFTDPTTLEDRLRASRNGNISAYLRTKGVDGNYTWSVHTIMVIPKTNYKQFMLLMRQAPLDDPIVRGKMMRVLRGAGKNLGPVDPGNSGNAGAAGASGLAGPADTAGGTGSYDTFVGADATEMMRDALLWRNLRDNGDVNYFWKDMDRRFLGVSKSFLDYYGLASEDDLLGKTDEDMRWHVADGPYKSDELEVLKEGKCVYKAPGKCIVRGVVRNILATKMPVYRDGKIIGLMGYFIDADHIEEEQGLAISASTVDLVTGLANTRGIMENLISYVDEHRSNNMEFAGIGILVEGYDAFRKDFGSSYGDQLLHRIADVIRAHFGTEAALGRLSGSHYIALYKIDDQSRMRQILSAIEADLKLITEVDGKHCTLYPSFSVAYATSTKDYEEMILSLLHPEN